MFNARVWQFFVAKVAGPAITKKRQTVRKAYSWGTRELNLKLHRCYVTNRWFSLSAILKNAVKLESRRSAKAGFAFMRPLILAPRKLHQTDCDSTINNNSLHYNAAASQSRLQLLVAGNRLPSFTATHHPDGHLHVYELTPSMHDAFDARHGSPTQSSTFAWHRSPSKPTRHWHLEQHTKGVRVNKRCAMIQRLLGKSQQRNSNSREEDLVPGPARSAIQARLQHTRVDRHLAVTALEPWE